MKNPPCAVPTCRAISPKAGKSLTLRLLLVSAATLLGAAGAAHAQVGVFSSDNAGNYSTWGPDPAGDNAGYGFGAWAITNSNGSGSWNWFLGTSVSNGNGSHTGINSSSGEAWGLNSTSTGSTPMDANRNIDSVTSGDAEISDLEVGETLRQDIDIGYITSGGSVGFSIRNASDLNLFEFYYQGGSATDGFQYTTNSSGATAYSSVNFGEGDDGLTTEFTLTSPTTYTFSIYASGASSSPLQTVTGSLITQSTGGETVANIRDFDYDGGNSGNTNNQYFNNLKVKEATWAVATSGNFSTNANWSGASFGGGPVAGASIAFNGNGAVGVTTATNDALSSVYNISFNETATPITGGTGMTNATPYVIAASTSETSLTVNGGINNNSTNNQTFSTPLVLGAAQSFAATNGALTFNGNVANGGNALTSTGGQNLSFSGGMGGGGAFNANGTGTVTISNTNTYSGATAINAGTMILSGSLSATSSGSVASGAALEVDGAFNSADTLSVTSGRLAGNGSVGGATLTSGTLAPGFNSTLGTPATGTLTAASSVSLDGNSTFAVRLSLAASGSDCDTLALTSGTATLGGSTLKLTLGTNGNVGGQAGTVYDIITDTASTTDISGTFAGLANNASFQTALGYTFKINYDENAAGTGSGDDVTLTLTAVPEPASWVGVLIGGGMLAGWFQLRKRRQG